MIKNSVTKLNCLVFTIGLCIVPVLTAQNHSDRVQGLYDRYISVMENLYFGRNQHINSLHLQQAINTLDLAVFTPQINIEHQIQSDIIPGAPQWISYLNEYRTKFRDLGRMYFSKIPKLCDKKPKIQGRDTVYKTEVYYKKWFAKKPDTIYRKMEVYVKNGYVSAGNIWNVDKRRFNRRKRCFNPVPPTITILDPSPNYTFYYRANKVDTIRWKTRLKPPFRMEFWIGNSVVHSLKIDSLVSKDSIYQYIWSPNYDVMNSPKLHSSSLKLKIAKKLNKNDISDSKAVNFKSVINIIRPLPLPFDDVLNHVWSTDPIFLNSLKEDKVNFKIEIVRADKEILYYTDSLFKSKSDASKSHLPVPVNTIKETKEAKDGEFEYGQYYYTKITLLEDENIYAKSNPYLLIRYLTCYERFHDAICCGTRLESRRALIMKKTCDEVEKSRLDNLKKIEDETKNLAKHQDDLTKHQDKDSIKRVKSESSISATRGLIKLETLNKQIMTLIAFQRYLIMAQLAWNKGGKKSLKWYRFDEYRSYRAMEFNIHRNREAKKDPDLAELKQKEMKLLNKKRKRQFKPSFLAFRQRMQFNTYNRYYSKLYEDTSNFEMIKAAMLKRTSKKRTPSKYRKIENTKTAREIMDYILSIKPKRILVLDPSRKVKQKRAVDKLYKYNYRVKPYIIDSLFQITDALDYREVSDSTVGNIACLNKKYIKIVIDSERQIIEELLNLNDNIEATEEEFNGIYDAKKDEIDQWKELDPSSLNALDKWCLEEATYFNDKLNRLIKKASEILLCQKSMKIRDSGYPCVEIKADVRKSKAKLKPK